MNIYTKTEELLSDTLTPISTFLNLRDEFANVSLFESNDYNSRKNSKSYICVEPIVSVEVTEGFLQLKLKGDVSLQKSICDGSELEQELKGFNFVNDYLAPHNGFFGVIGYNAIPLFEDISFSTLSSELAEIYLAAYKFVLEFDHFFNRLTLIYNSFEEEENELATLVNLLNKRVSPTDFFRTKGEINSNETDASFKKKVAMAKEHVAQGEVFQLVISREFSQEFEGDDFEVYRQLRTLNPSPYMFYFDLEKAKLIGASPEAQIIIQNKKAEIHPIAGTVKKSLIDFENEQAVEHLKSDEKENAEHMMLVDLARNDLNRSCLDVKVEKLKEVQSFSHVIHLVSKVTGQVESDSSLKTFGGSFPAGTLSGAPKYKAMELIDELEESSRQYYGGAVGLISANGDVNMAIIIRTILSHKNQLSYQAGAGIVMDSTEEGECQEVYNKIGSVQTAIKNASI